MQSDDRTNRTTDPDVDEPVVGEPDEQAAATDPRGGNDDVWQGVQPVEGTEAVDEDQVDEDIVEDTHPVNVQPITPDLGGIQPVDPELGTGEPVDETLGIDSQEDL